MANFNTHEELLAAARTLPEMKSMPLHEFVDWLTDNEKIYLAFRRFAAEAIMRKRKRFSAYMIRERVRWYTNIEYDGNFKISNNVTPYIARLLVLDMPALGPIFSRKADPQPEVQPGENHDMFSHG